LILKVAPKKLWGGPTPPPPPAPSMHMYDVSMHHQRNIYFPLQLFFSNRSWQTDHDDDDDDQGEKGLHSQCSVYQLILLSLSGHSSFHL
jgi:hypothetical protein